MHLASNSKEERAKSKEERGKRKEKIIFNILKFFNIFKLFNIINLSETPFLILEEQILGFAKYGADGLYKAYCPFGTCEGSAKGAL